MGARCQLPWHIGFVTRRHDNSSGRAQHPGVRPSFFRFFLKLLGKVCLRLGTKSCSHPLQVSAAASHLKDRLFLCSSPACGHASSAPMPVPRWLQGLHTFLLQSIPALPSPPRYSMSRLCFRIMPRLMHSRQLPGIQADERCL